MKAVRETIDVYGLRATFRLIDAAPDIVHDVVSGTKYVDANSLHLLLWGYSEHGQLAGQGTLRFRVHFDQILLRPLDEHFAAMTTILGPRLFDIADQNDLRDYRVVARNLFEVCLLSTALFLFQRNEIAAAVPLLETLYTSLRRPGPAHTVLTTTQIHRIEEFLQGGYSTLALDYHRQGKHAASQRAMARMLQLAPDNRGALERKAFVCYRLGDVAGAKHFTSELRRLDPENPAVAVNNAFFAILEGNYEAVGSWYDTLRSSPRVSELNLPEIVSFLDGEHEARPGEHAFLYGIAVVQGLVDPQARPTELRSFLRETHGLPEYQPLVRRATESLDGAAQ